MDASFPVEPVRRLGEFLTAFSGCFGRASQVDGARRYAEGLISKSERKSMQRVHGAVRDPGSYQALQHFITHSRWDSAKLWKRLRRRCPTRDGVLLIDDTGLPKKGSLSPGVQRQYTGTLGKIANCQIVVTTILRTADLSWPIAMELYLPESWTSDASRLRQAGVSETTRFRPKWEIALEQIRTARKAGFRIRAVVGDSAFGCVAEFRKALRRDHFRFVLGVKENVSVSRRGAAKISAEKLADALPSRAWKKITWRKGTKGPLTAEFAALRVTPVGPAAEETECWLLCERRNSERIPKYFFSNLPKTAPIEHLVKLAHTRWAIELNYQQLKEELGFDHFEGRSWNGWCHHAVLTAATYAFLELERREKIDELLTLPKVRELVSEILWIQIVAERPDLQDAVRFEIERKAGRSPP